MCDLDQFSPLIGLSDNYCGERHNMREEYSRAIKMAGGIPVIIPFTLDSKLIALTVSRLDGVLMIGGDDIHASHFNQAMSPLADAPYPDRDLFDLALIKECARVKKPTFGICRGMQCMAVAFGGSLVQDLGSEMGAQYERHRKELDGAHRVDFQNSAFYKDSFVTNTHHHQEVKQVGQGWKITGLSEDGIIEAIEAIDYPMWGVQFHPERMNTHEINPSTGMAWPHDTAPAVSIFEQFINLCKK